MNRHALLVFAVLLASAPALHAQLRDVDRDKAIQDIKKLNGQYQIDNNRADKPIVAVYLEGASVLDRDIESLGPLHRLRVAVGRVLEQHLVIQHDESRSYAHPLCKRN